MFYSASIKKGLDLTSSPSAGSSHCMDAAAPRGRVPATAVGAVFKIYNMDLKDVQKTIKAEKRRSS